MCANPKPLPLFCLESKIKHGITPLNSTIPTFKFCLESKIKHGITATDQICRQR